MDAGSPDDCAPTAGALPCGAHNTKMRHQCSPRARQWPRDLKTAAAPPGGFFPIPGARGGCSPRQLPAPGAFPTGGVLPTVFLPAASSINHHKSTTSYYEVATVARVFSCSGLVVTSFFLSFPRKDFLVEICSSLMFRTCSTSSNFSKVNDDV